MRVFIDNEGDDAPQKNYARKKYGIERLIPPGWCF